MAREESRIPGFMDQFLWLCKSVSMWISTYEDRRETIDVSLIGCWHSGEFEQMKQLDSF